MKIAVIDNTCNSGYVLMRFLNDRGYDTDLIILGGTEPHSDPENDTFTAQYFDKIVYTGWERLGMLKLTPDAISKVLDKYDFIIGSDFAPAICYRIRRKLDVFLPHGTDLFEYPFRKLRLLSFRRKDIGDRITAAWQKAGIERYTGHFIFDMTNEENESYIRRFSHPQFQRIYLASPHLYYPQYAHEELLKAAASLPETVLLRQLKSEGHVILFHHCQQIWASPQHPLFDKGTDKIIRGLHQFVTTAPDKKVKLVMFERGHDVAASKALIQALDLEAHITWMPSMPRKHIMTCLVYADIGIGELGHSWFSYNVVTEFMAMKVPVVHNCDIAYFSRAHQSVYPMYHAATADDIAGTLASYFSAPGQFRESGIQAHRWWRHQMADKSLDFIIGLIEQKRSGLPAR